MTAEIPNNDTSAEANQTGLSLRQQIHLQILNQGPMSLATYMRLCLTHPKYGYYKTADPIGRDGDFVTAPEISQMFGEMLGAWVLSTWYVLGRPARFDLVELGPGRGTLMADALRMIAQDKDAFRALNLVLLETNPVLKQQQKLAVAPQTCRWISEIAELEANEGPLIMLANEFFDALPIQQYQFADDKWHERLIGLNDEKLVFGLSPTPMPSAAMPAQISGSAETPVTEGTIWETGLLAQRVMTDIATLLNQRGGGLLAIDYGYAHTRTGESFQAVSKHKFADPLDAPGQADLTAHVDFEALINAARATGANAHLVGTQAQLLEELGIRQRAAKLVATNPDQQANIDTALDRLVGDEQMGKLFKAMVVFGAPS